jgi:hypothetical protein
MSTTGPTASDVRPFQVDIPDEKLVELTAVSRRRAGPPGSWWAIDRRACSLRRSRRRDGEGEDPLTGRPSQ